MCLHQQQQWEAEHSLDQPAASLTRDVRNRFFISVRFFEKPRIRLGMSLVQFGSKDAVQFGYYSCLLPA